MGRFHVKKQDTFIDMTPMSDVMVLLLTFFMLTATFTKEEPVKINVPGSVSDIKIPANNLLTIFVSPQGKVFMNMDNPIGQKKMVEKMVEEKKLDLNAAQVDELANAPMFGTSFDTMKSWLSMEKSRRNEILTKSEGAGIPCDTANDELQDWVKAARAANGDNMGLAIKADSKTPYKTIKQVMKSLRRIHENRYNLITTLKGGEDK